MALSMDSILKLSTSRKLLILIAILFVMAGLYFYSIFMPQHEELNGLRAELNKLVLQVNENKKVTKDLAKFRKQREELNAELKDALNQLPNEKEIPEILKNISSLGRESNLDFLLFRPKPEDPQQFYAKVPIELTVVGSYHNTGIFFDKMSKLPRIINIVDFSMSRAGDKDAKGKGEAEVLVKTSCLANTYRFLEKKGEEKKSGQKTGKKEEDSSEFGEMPKAPKK